jgi:DNA-binding transcriptional regulator PaaX
MDPKDDMLISRAEVMRRWRISIESVKRREKEGVLRPVRIGWRAVRYRLSDVVRAEEQAADRYQWKKNRINEGEKLAQP